MIRGKTGSWYWLYPLLLTVSLVNAEQIRTPQDTLLEVSLTPAVGVIGQKRLLTVTVLTEHWFAGSTVFPDIDVVPGLVQKQEGFANNFTVRRNGRQYAAQSREYAIFPTAAGRLVVPPLRVSAKVAVPEAGPQGFEERLLWQSPVVFDVSPLTEVSASTPVATSLNIRSDFQNPLAGQVAGQLLIRTLRVEASDTLAVLLPEIPLMVPDNVRQYRALPILEDLRGRARFLARRSEQVSYVFEKPGVYTLPEIPYRWWNSDTGRSEESVIEAVRVEVVPASDPWPDSQGAFPVRIFVVLIIVLVIVLLAMTLYGARARLRALALRGLDRLSNQCKRYRPSRLPPLN